MTRSIYTTLTPLPAGVPRWIVREALHDHFLMIDLNPLVIKRERMSKPLGKATAEEWNCTWYEITDRISYFPGVKGQVTYHGAFHDLENGLQTHIYAPMGLDIREKWTVGGNEPGEPRQTAELGIQAPRDGLYIREDVDLNVNLMLLSFVKKNLVNAHKQLVERMVERAKLIDNQNYNANLGRTLSQSNPNRYSAPGSVSPTSPQTQVHPGQGYTSSTHVYDERYGVHGQGWYDPNLGPYSRSPGQPGDLPPFAYSQGFPSDHKYGYTAPGQGGPPRASELSPQDPAARYRMTLEEASKPHVQELPATSDKPLAEMP